MTPKGRNASGPFELTNMSTKTGDEYKGLKDKYDAARVEWLKKYEAYFADNKVDVILTPTTNGLPAPSPLRSVATRSSACRLGDRRPFNATPS